MFRIGKHIKINKLTLSIRAGGLGIREVKQRRVVGCARLGCRLAAGLALKRIEFLQMLIIRQSAFPNCFPGKIRERAGLTEFAILRPVQLK